MDMNERHRTLFQLSGDFRFANRLFALLRFGSASRQSSGRYDFSRRKIGEKSNEM